MDQRKLEQEQIKRGQDRYTATVDKARVKGQEAVTKAGLTLTQKAVEPTAKLIEEFCEKARQINQAEIGEYLDKFDKNLIAFFTARRCINSYQHPVSLTKAAGDIAGMLQDHADYMRFKEEDREACAKTEKKLKYCRHYRHRKIVFKRFQRWAGVSSEDWSYALKVKMGMRLIECFVKATGFVEIKNVPVRKGRKIRSEVLPTAKLEAELKEQHELSALLTPYFLPMVEEPSDWTNIFNGGYLTKPLKSWKFIKSFNRQYVTELNENSETLTEVFKAVNALQKTAWRINPRVLEVQETLWNSGGGPEVGLPSRNKLELPLCPICKGTVDGKHSCFDLEENAGAFKAWKRAAAGVYDENVRLRSKRIAEVQKLLISKKFVGEDEIFFPYQLDWRGRVYPAPIFVNPQADDAGKSLLEFAYTKPVGKNGIRWLKIQAANSFGEDKVSLDDREKWATDHADKIVECASSPYEARWWAEADKPYQFLAACFELAEFWKCKAEGREEDFESALPCSIDGSCNGLQNYSAMLRDPQGAKATNLIPDALPNDIYSDVADLVWEKIFEDCENRDSEDYAEAILWETVTDRKLRRKLVKRNVMTMPYSATERGMCGQLTHEVQQLRDKGERVIDIDDPWKACHYLAKLNYLMIRSVVPAAAEAMDWLMAVAKVVSKRNVPVNWTTPLGFWVQQWYPKAETYKIECILNGIRFQPRLYKETTKLNSRKMAQAIAPNFIHSMDASHLMSTVLRCEEKGIDSFGMVHDSYATHAGDMDRLSSILRECFIEQYSGDILEDFRNEILTQLPKKMYKQIPEVPSIGTLDLSQIQQSLYFFA